MEGGCCGCVRVEEKAGSGTGERWTKLESRAFTSSFTPALRTCPSASTKVGLAGRQDQCRKALGHSSLRGSQTSMAIFGCPTVHITPMHAPVDSVSCTSAKCLQPSLELALRSRFEASSKAQLSMVSRSFASKLFLGEGKAPSAQSIAVLSCVCKCSMCRELCMSTRSPVFMPRVCKQLQRHMAG